MIRSIDLLHLPDLTAAISIERGATVPSDPYSGFNLCHYSGDSPLHIGLCLEQLRNAVGARCFVIPRQTHSSTVATIGEHDIDTSTGVIHPADTDALVTSLPDVALCINTADCVPVVLSDPDARVIGIAHSGWRGTVARIAARTVEAMTRLGASPDRIKAAMGPCICSGCFEVGPEVAAKFAEEGLSGKHVVSINPLTGRHHISLPEAIADTLVGAGLRPGNIARPAVCSRCNPDRFCSARAAGVNSARTLTLICQNSVFSTDRVEKQCFLSKNMLFL